MAPSGRSSPECCLRTANTGTNSRQTEPFKGLLLGLFFIAVGMSVNLGLIVDKPGLVAGHRRRPAGDQRPSCSFALGRRMGLEAGPARRLALVLSQGGEFAFALFAAARSGRWCWSGRVADLLAVAVTLSMAATPLLLSARRDAGRPRQRRSSAPSTELPKNDGHVVIAGFGRFGQIVARVLTAKRISVTALDSDPEQVDFVRRFGAQILRRCQPAWRFCRRRRSARRVPSCWPSTTLMRRCALPAWCAAIIRTCRSTPAPATAGISTS